MDYAKLALLFCGVIWIILPMSFSTEVNLTDTREATTDLNWDTFPSDGSGWNELSNTDENQVPLRTFQVCGIRTPGQNNWFKTNYIELKEGAKNVYVEIKFTIRSCEDLPRAATCKETFNLYYLESDSPSSGKHRSMNHKVYKKIDTIAADRQTQATDTETRKIGPIKGKGIYVAFQDTGACMIIYYVRVYYKKCDQITQNLATFESTLTGPQVTSFVKVTGKCVTNAISTDKNERGPTLLCNSEAKWKLLEGSCQCLPGYQPNENKTECTECPIGYHKSTVGNSRCMKCPKNSVTIKEGSQKCICTKGYYRTYKESARSPCTKPPSKPERVQYVVEDTTVDLTWSPPNDNGGRRDVYYSVSCFRCDSTYSLCSDCADIVDYEPSGRYLVEPRIYVRALSPHTNYRFRIFSYNGVSKTSGQEAIFAEALLKTSESAPSAVRNVRIIKRTTSEIDLNWDFPVNAHGIIQGYELQYWSEGDGRISRSNRTSERSFRIRYLPRGTTFTIQVRARNGAGFGPFSPPVPMSTLDTKEFHFPNPANIGGSPFVEPRGDVEDMTSSTSDVITTEYLPVALIIAISSALLIVVVAALFVIKQRRNRNPKYGCADLEVYPFFDNAVDLLHAHRERRSFVDPSTYGNPDNAVHELAKEIDPFNIKKEDLMASGEFGDVYKGYLRPTSFIYDDTITTTTSIRSSNLLIAIKTLKQGATEQQKQEFLEEALVMGQFLHPNVIRLEGVVTRTTPLMIITEYMANGALDKFLEERHLRGIELEVYQLVNMLRDIADGMKYLSDMGYVHRDLAARNILVNDQLICKVSDFGLSRELENIQDEDTAIYTTKGGMIPVRWTAPEAITQRTFTSSSDVWGFGVVMWEVLTHGERPYWEMTNSDVVHCVENGYRLPPPPFCPRILHNLMLNCWNMDRTRRPTFTQIVSQLDNILTNPEKLQDTINNIPLHEQAECIPESLDLSSLGQWLEDMNMTQYKDIMLRNGCVTAEQIIRLTPNKLDEMGITEHTTQNILLNGAEILRQKLLQVNVIGIGVTV
ncbi:ephrin type-A receptor 4-B-like isoform X1 [Styela clava]